MRFPRTAPASSDSSVGSVPSSHAMPFDRELEDLVDVHRRRPRSLRRTLRCRWRAPAPPTFTSCILAHVHLLRSSRGSELVRRDLVGRHHMRVHVERHRRARVPRPMGELARRHPRLMPDRDPAMPEVVRVVVRDAGGLAGPQHRLVRGRLRDPLEDAPLRGPILERADRLDRVDQPLGQVDPPGLVSLRRRTRQAKP